MAMPIFMRLFDNLTYKGVFITLTPLSFIHSRDIEANNPGLFERLTCLTHITES
jgi:hypothetical protein